MENIRPRTGVFSKRRAGAGVDIFRNSKSKTFEGRKLSYGNGRRAPKINLGIKGVRVLVGDKFFSSEKGYNQTHNFPCYLGVGGREGRRGFKAFVKF